MKLSSTTPTGPDGALQGLNNYRQWFVGDSSMEGPYQGYDGPCPPFNDSIPHRYVFTLHALSVAKLDLKENFGLEDLRNALNDKVLESSTLTARYTTNPDIRLK